MPTRWFHHYPATPFLLIPIDKEQMFPNRCSIMMFYADSHNALILFTAPHWDTIVDNVLNKYIKQLREHIKGIFPWALH